MGDNLPAISDRNFTAKLLGKIKQISTEAAAGLTGIFASERKELVLSVGRLFQGLINRELIDNLLREWNEFREKGRIKDDYQQTEQHHACLQEMLDFLDSDKPDKIRFEFMKKIFLSAATETISDRESALPQQYMYLARKLSSGDVLVLNGVYEMYILKKFNSSNNDADAWLKDVAKHTALNHTDLVEYHEKHLMELGILAGRTMSDRSGILRSDFNRMTTLALDLCGFIKGYNEIAASDSKGDESQTTNS